MKYSDFIKRGDKLLFLVALAVLAVSVFRGLYSTDLFTRTEPPITIVFTQWWDRDIEDNFLLSLIRDFENQHEGIRISLSYKPYDELLFALTDNNGIFPGDVLALDPLWISELEKNEIIQKASPPLLSFINVLFYNTGILRDAGFSMPPKSRTEFINYARTVAGLEGNRWGLVVDEKGSRRLYDDVFPWIWSAGTQLISGGRPTVNSRPVIDSLSFLAALKSEGLLVQGNKLEDFSSGKAAFMISSSRNIEFVRERLGDTSFDISNIPVPDNYAGRSLYGAAEWAIGVNSASVHEEEAKLFADFLIGEAHVLAEKTREMPGDRGLPRYAPFYSKAWDIAAVWEPAREFSGHPWLELEKVFSEELSSLFSGDLTPVQTAAAIQRRWSDLLSP